MRIKAKSNLEFPHLDCSAPPLSRIHVPSRLIPTESPFSRPLSFDTNPQNLPQSSTLDPLSLSRSRVVSLGLVRKSSSGDLPRLALSVLHPSTASHSPLRLPPSLMLSLFCTQHLPSMCTGAPAANAISNRACISSQLLSMCTGAPAANAISNRACISSQLLHSTQLTPLRLRLQLLQSTGPSRSHTSKPKPLATSLLDLLTTSHSIAPCSSRLFTRSDLQLPHPTLRDPSSKPLPTFTPASHATEPPSCTNRRYPQQLATPTHDLSPAFVFRSMLETPACDFPPHAQLRQPDRSPATRVTPCDGTPQSLASQLTLLRPHASRASRPTQLTRPPPSPASKQLSNPCPALRVTSSLSFLTQTPSSV